MDATQGKAFLKALGSPAQVETKDWLRAKCPLAPWLHEKKSDSSPSFGLRLAPSGKSFYHCFACNSGALSALVQSLEMYTHYGKDDPDKYDFKVANDILIEEESTIHPLPGYSEFSSDAQKHFIPWEPEVLDYLPPAIFSAVARRYLAYRGFSLQEAQKQYLRVDVYRNMLVFPYWNAFGKLAGMRGRLMDFGKPMVDINGNPRLKHFDYTLSGDDPDEKNNNSHFCWLGEECLQDLTKPVIVVEGQFDRMRVLRHYPNVVANMTSKPSAAKLDKLMWSPGVILLLDSDATGEGSTLKWTKRLQDAMVLVGHIPLTDAPKSQFHIDRDGPGAPKDPDEVDEGWLKENLKGI